MVEPPLCPDQDDAHGQNGVKREYRLGLEVYRVFVLYMRLLNQQITRVCIWRWSGRWLRIIQNHVTANYKRTNKALIKFAAENNQYSEAMDKTVPVLKQTTGGREGLPGPLSMPPPALTPPLGGRRADTFIFDANFNLLPYAMFSRSTCAPCQHGRWSFSLSSHRFYNRSLAF